MHKNIPVLKAEYSDESHQFLNIIEVLNEAHLPIGTRKMGDLTLKRLNYWYMRRAIPGYRVALNFLLDRLSLSHPMDLVEFTHAVSVSDTYWLKNEEESLSYEDVSFFRHSFDENGFIRAMFSTVNDKAPESARVTPNSNTAGFHRKAWVKRNGQLFLLKGGYPFYQMEPVNEWLAYKLGKQIGISVLPYETETYETNLVSVCPCFTDENTDLVTAEMILLETETPKNKLHLNTYLNELDQHGIRNAKKKVADQIMLDYIMMNTDRHAQNMGILVDAETGEWKDTAPIFDTGTALASLVADKEVLSEERFQECSLLNKRHFCFEELLKYINLSDYDYSNVLDLPHEYGNRLVRYQPISHITDERIENTYTLFYKQLLKVRKLSRQAK